MPRSNSRFALAIGVALVILTLVAVPVAGTTVFQADDPGPPEDGGPDEPGPPDDAGPPEDDEEDDDDDDDTGGEDDDEDEGDDDDDAEDDEDEGDDGERDDDDDAEGEDDDSESDDEDDGDAENDGDAEGEDDDDAEDWDGDSDEAADERRDGSDAEAETGEERGMPTFLATHPDASSVGVVDVAVREDPVRTGEPVQIDVRLANRGEDDRTLAVRLRMFGEVANRTETTIPAGEARTVTFVHEVVQPGTYEPSVYGVSDEFVVESGDSEDPEREGDRPSDDSLAGFGAVGVITALLVVSRLRRRAS